MEDRWAGEGPTGDAYRPEGHLFADDLDLFGEGSLFQLLCTARTEVGAATLAAWLLEPAPLEEGRSRQEAVRLLAPRLDLREDFALAGEDVRSALGRHDVQAWARTPRRLEGRRIRAVLGALAVVTTTSFVAWAFFGASPLPFAVSGLLQFLVSLPLRARVDAVLGEADRPSQDLALASQLLERFEAEGFEAGRLGELRATLQADGAPPSKHIAALVRLMEFVDARRNQIFLPISWLLALGTQLAFSIEGWRARHGESMVVWLESPRGTRGSPGLRGVCLRASRRSLSRAGG